MVDVVQFRQSLWASSIVLNLTFEKLEGIEVPALMVNVKRISYLSQLCTKIRKHVSLFLPKSVLDATSPLLEPGASQTGSPFQFLWFSRANSGYAQQQQAVVAWHYPIGVLVPESSSSGLATFRVCFGKNLPDSVMDLEAEGALRSLFFDSLKQASQCVFGTTQPIMTLSTSDGRVLWDSFSLSDLSMYLPVRNKLFERPTVGAILMVHFADDMKCPLTRKLTDDVLSRSLVEAFPDTFDAKVSVVSIAGCVVDKKVWKSCAIRDLVGYASSPDLFLRIQVASAYA
eukprot:ANDGO_08623.mRNA.1 hypothetical protein